MAIADINWTTPLYPSSGAIAIGDLLCKSSDGLTYVKATTANRGTQRCYHISLGVADSVIVLVTPAQATGVVQNSVTDLGTGAASWVRCSTGGRMERVSPAGADDVVGWCETNGDVHLAFGTLTATIINAAGGGEVNTASNLGAGVGLFASKVGADLQFKGLVAGTNITLTPSGTGVTIDSAGGSGFTAGGDLSGTSTVQSVDKIHGATVPIAGALTTGNLLFVSGVSALSYGALNLAGGSNYVTGLLPLANQNAPTGTGFAAVTGGSWNAASTAYPITVPVGGTGATTFGTAGILHGSGTSAVTCSLIVNADVAAGAAIVSTKLAPPGSATQVLFVGAGPAFAADSGFTYGSGVANLSTRLTLGATPSTTGAVCLTNNTAIKQKSSGGTDLNLCGFDSSDVGNFGDYQNGTWSVLQAKTNVGILVGDDGANYVWLWQHATSCWQSGGPIIGFASQASPHGVHGRKDIPMADANHTATSAEYVYTQMRTTGVTSASRTLTIPAPADDAHAYWKFINNACTSTGPVVVSTGTGTTVSVGTGLAVWIWVDSSGCQRAQSAASITGW